MRVTGVDLNHVEIPPIAAIARLNPRIYDITICRVRTDEGLEGIGESAVYVLSVEGRARLEAQAAAYVGQDPLAVDPFAQEDLFECAFLDLQGQALGWPVWRFFGPRVRERVPVSYWSSAMPAAETAAEAEARPPAGVHQPQTQGPHPQHRRDRAPHEGGGGTRVHRRRRPEHQLRPRPHRRPPWRPSWSPFGTVANFEDPIPKENLDSYRLLREKTHIPVAMHIGVPQGRRPCRGADVLAAPQGRVRRLPDPRRPGPWR